MSLFLLLASLTAQADELSVSPAWLDVDASSGTTVTQMLTIGMSGRGARQVRVYTGDWTWEDGRSAFPPTGTSERSAELSVDATTLWVDASEPTQVPVQIHIPNVGAGATYGVIFVEEVVPDVTEDGGMITTSRIAVPVLVANGQPTVDIDRVDSFVSDEDSMLRVDLSLANNGVSHAQRRRSRGDLLRSRQPVSHARASAGPTNRRAKPSCARSLRVDGCTGH
jgi:hypothetical protein